MQMTGNTNQLIVMYLRTYAHTHIIHTYMAIPHQFPFNEKTRSVLRTSMAGDYSCLAWPKAQHSSFKNSKRIAWEHIPSITIYMGISLLLWMQCTHAPVQTQPSATSQFHEWWYTKGRYGTSPVCGGIYVHVQCPMSANSYWRMTRKWDHGLPLGELGLKTCVGVYRQLKHAGKMQHTCPRGTCMVWDKNGSHLHQLRIRTYVCADIEGLDGPSDNKRWGRGNSHDTPLRRCCLVASFEQYSQSS